MLSLPATEFTQPVRSRLLVSSAYLAGLRDLPWPCQNKIMPAYDEPELAVRLAHELVDCRQRGIERLDVHTHNMQPVKAPELERLATDYATARGDTVHGRVPLIKNLLRAALPKLAMTDKADAQLIRDLFFGDDTSKFRRSANDLLKRAKDRYGEPSDGRFREIRNAALLNFAEFLVDFVAKSPSATPVASSDGPPAHADRGSRPSTTARMLEQSLAAVLRFSVVDPGASDNLTIEKHVEIIDRYGRCWWGWFRADADDSDRTVELAQRLGNCDVGLWERAEGLFYVAHCGDVRVDNGRLVESPEGDLTPEYYRDQKYPAWFSFRSIRRSDAQEFAERFGILPDIPSTIYFEPEAAEPLVIQSHGSSILHLSDLYFGRHHRWSTASVPHRSVMTADQAIVQTMLLHNVDLATIGQVIICGNFVSEEPTSEAYHDALAFIDGLCEQLPSVEREHVVILPGSDDFGRPGDRERSGQTLYREFHQGLYGAAEQDLTRVRRYDSDTFRLNVLPVNSVKLLGTNERDEGQFGSGYDRQLAQMRLDYLRHQGHTRVINIVAAHHHLISTPVKLPETVPQEPVRARVMPGIHDARDVLARLSGNRVMLFLHGHLHEPDCYTVTSDDGWQTEVCCTGTAGASDSWLRARYRENHGNSLALYDVDQDRIRGRMFLYDENLRHSPSPAKEFEIRNPLRTPE